MRGALVRLVTHPEPIHRARPGSGWPVIRLESVNPCRLATSNPAKRPDRRFRGRLPTQTTFVLRRRKGSFSTIDIAPHGALRDRFSRDSARARSTRTVRPDVGRAG